MNTSTEKTLIISCHSAGMGSILKGAMAGLLHAELTGAHLSFIGTRTVKAQWKRLFSK